MTLLMKMHSYSFYCGHLSVVKRKLQSLDKANLNTESDEQAELRETLAFELTAPSGSISYPQNLTMSNFADYLLCPTLCYELSYPRTDR